MKHMNQLFSLNYIQIPVLFQMRLYSNMNATNHFVEVGPYLGIGIGKVKSESCLDGKCETIENDYYSEDIEGPKPWIMVFRWVQV